MKINTFCSWTMALTLGLSTTACVTDFSSDDDECTGGQEMCGTSCTDLQTSEDHCGTCNNACGSDEECIGGSCEPEGCPGGETDCDGTCADLQSDHDHCGTCENACNPDEVCAEGVCSAECPDTLENCGGSCVDLQTDDEHCGMCDELCDPGETCIGGVCVPGSTCPTGQEDCGSGCTYLDTDPDNCGECGLTCEDNEICDDGDCICSEGLGLCEGECVTDSDGDTIGDDCDDCPSDDPDDTDGDTICDSDDLCHGMDDIINIANPGFTTSGDWVMHNGAIIDSTAPGAIDSGEAYIDGESLCLGGAVTQDVCIPGTFESIGPLLLSFYHRQDDCIEYMYCEGGAGVAFNDHFNETPGWNYTYADPTHLCLGEAAYGGVVTLAMSGRGNTWTGSCVGDYTAPRAYDNVTILDAPTNTCPAPGTVLNGDFSLGLTGWSGYGSYSIETESGGDQQLLLVGPAGTCSAASATGLISQPLLATMPHSAVQLNWQATSGWRFQFQISGGKNSITHYFDGSDTWNTDIVCLGPANEGVVQQIMLRLDFLSGTCATQPYRSLRIDDLEIVSDPASCP